MKVKVLSIYDEPYKGSYRVPPAEQVESTLREWLKDNPNAKIEHVVQTPLAELEGPVPTRIFYPARRRINF